MVERAGLEGVVATPLGSVYRPGERGWLKVKTAPPGITRFSERLSRPLLLVSYCQTFPVITKETMQTMGVRGHGPDDEDSQPRPRRPAYAFVPLMTLQFPRSR